MLSLKSIDWLNTKATFWVLVISYIWRNLGYDIVLWLAGLSTIPESLYEAAKVDGAGAWKCFTRITCPNLLPSLFTIVVLSLLNGFKYSGRLIGCKEIIHRRTCIFCSICSITGTETWPWIRWRLRQWLLELRSWFWYFYCKKHGKERIKK